TLGIVGESGSGKTTLAIALARHYQTEIINGDSRQFYREMRIGNARPTEEELAQATHHFVADRSLSEPLTAGRFAELALARLADIFQSTDYAILTGGSGLYLRAVAEGLDEFPEVPTAVASQVEALSHPALLAALDELDPAYAATVDRANPRRLQRALKVCYASGKPYSSFLGNRPPRPFHCVYLRTQMPRESLYDRINRRVDLMLKEGLEAEARSLLPHRELPVLQTVGYQEWWPCFAGEYDRARAVELIKRNSRRYAKRQITWFGRGETYTPVTDLAEAQSVILQRTP
ncbi:MAG: tRNA (adenosine(37)-N6)-dimethylallyltransferase MiaA, partial [Bacteroidota bacterium]